MPIPEIKPVTLTLEPHELTAITDALTVYDLLADGCLPTALELVDQADDGGATKATLDSQRTAREKIDAAQKPYHDAIKAWMREQGFLDGGADA